MINIAFGGISVNPDEADGEGVFILWPSGGLTAPGKGLE
jgi:hypothetical protein